jgi:hypothetical protein
VLVASEIFIKGHKDINAIKFISKKFIENTSFMPSAEKL